MFLICRPLAGPDPEVWGGESVGAHGGWMGACPDLAVCCAGFLVGSEYIHSTVKLVPWRNEPLVPRLLFLLLCRAANRKSLGNSRLWRPLISCSSPLPVPRPLIPAPPGAAVRRKTAGSAPLLQASALPRDQKLRTLPLAEARRRGRGRRRKTH